jgi:mono/diheme cytochrome c family protein
VRRALILALSLLAAAGVVEGAVLGWLAVRAHWRKVAEAGAVPRGREIAQRMGCFACHGADGAHPIPNPGSKTGDVPGWAGGTWMMWNRSEGDVRAWILEGHPPGREPDAGALIRMPPYRGRLDDDETDALVAYVLAASLFGQPSEPAVADGRDAALRYGCFGCHGPEGRGLVSNPGSLKGYVPGWEGGDFQELVRSDDEFRQWVRNGISDRMKANPVARRILESQAIRMPAFGERVSATDMEALLAYVHWVGEHPRLTTAAKPSGE